MTTMASTGAIPKVPRRQIRSPFSGIGNFQTNPNTPFFLMTTMYQNETITRDTNNVLIEKLSEAKNVLDELKENVDKMKEMVSDIENKDPNRVYFVKETPKTIFNNSLTPRRVTFQTKVISPVKEIRKVEKEIADTEMKIRELQNEVSKINASPPRVPTSDYCNNFRERVARERLNFIRNQTSPLKKWPNTENLDNGVTSVDKNTTAQENNSGTSRQIEELQKIKNTSVKEEIPGPSRELKILEKTRNINEGELIKKRNDDSILSFHSSNLSADLGGEINRNNCVKTVEQPKNIERNEPQIVIQKVTQNVESDDELENNKKIQKESNDAINMESENKQNESKVQIGKEGGNESTQLENRSYIDLKAFDFIEKIFKKKKPQDAKDKTNEDLSLEMLQDLNKSICWDDDGVDDLQLKISQLSVAGLQATKLIEMCMRKPHLETSPERIEAESILLLSRLKQKMLKDNLKGSKHQNDYLPKHGCLKISQIRMPLIYSPEAHPNIKRYYVVVFQWSDQLFSSRVLEPNRHSYLEIPETIIFDELPADFAIKVSLYSMYVEKTTTTNETGLACLPFKFVKELFTPTRSEEEPPIICWVEREPSFKLHGQCMITLSNLHKNPFTINGVPPSICLVNTMECVIEKAVSLRNSEKGYLNIGKYRNDGSVSWRRRWCVVNGSKIKLWKGKKDVENKSCEELNLSKCLVQWECKKKCVCR